MELRELIIDGISLGAPAMWSFHGFAGMIVGRRQTRVGTFQISTAYRTALGERAGPAECREILAGFASSDGFTARGEETAEASDGAVLGRGAWTDGRAFRRGWYRLTDRGLVLGLYQCPIHRVEEARPEIEECEAIARTLSFI